MGFVGHFYQGHIGPLFFSKSHPMCAVLLGWVCPETIRAGAQVSYVGDVRLITSPGFALPRKGFEMEQYQMDLLPDDSTASQLFVWQLNRPPPFFLRHPRVWSSGELGLIQKPWPKISQEGSFGGCTCVLHHVCAGRARRRLKAISRSLTFF